MFIQDYEVVSKRRRRTVQARILAEGKAGRRSLHEKSVSETEHNLRWKQLLETA
jgi:hypothetical protein